MIICEKLVIVSIIYLTVNKANSKAFNSYSNTLSTLEDCPVPLSVDRYRPGRTLQKLDGRAIKRGLEKFPGIYSNLHRLIKTYEILSKKPHSQLDGAKVNTLINLQEIIYSMLNVEPEKEQQKLALPASRKFKCPKKSEIKPCKCSCSDKPTLNCSDVKSFVALKQILNTAEFPSTNFTLFTYYPATPNESEAVLLNNTFGPLSFTQIFIGKSGLKEMEPIALNGSQDTLELFMSDGNRMLEHFPFDNLGQYKKVISLTITKSLIDQIPPLNSPSLKYLDLNSNQLSKLGHDAFSTLPSLITLDLSYNNIEKLSPHGLYITSPDCIIYLNRNQLKGMFPFSCYQPYLLDESHNYLTTFREVVYKPILEMKSYVDVTSNNINCSELQWAEEEPQYHHYIISDCYK